jgi:hypothetical protein
VELKGNYIVVSWHRSFSLIHPLGTLKYNLKYCGKPDSTKRHRADKHQHTLGVLQVHSIEPSHVGPPPGCFRCECRWYVVSCPSLVWSECAARCLALTRTALLVTRWRLTFLTSSIHSPCFFGFFITSWSIIFSPGCMITYGENSST